MQIIVRHTCNLNLNDKSIQRKIGIGIIQDFNPNAWMESIGNLHAEEQHQLNQKITNDAKNSFYLARMAAKMAITNLTGLEANNTWIDHGVFGYPVLENDLLGLGISLAHTVSSGFAACYDHRDKIGVDIELVNETKNTVIETALTKREIELVNTKGNNRTVYLHLIWAAREALSKALQTGFLIPLELLEVDAVIKNDGYYEFTFKHFSLFKSKAFEFNKSICTIAYPERCLLNIEPILTLLKRNKSEYSQNKVKEI